MIVGISALSLSSQAQAQSHTQALPQAPGSVVSTAVVTTPPSAAPALKTAPHSTATSSAKPPANHAKSDETPLPANAERISHGRFKDVIVYRPKGVPKEVVLFLSGDSGWNLSLADMANTLVDLGAMVIGINTPQLIGELEADSASCVLPDGDLENLAHFVQAYYRLPNYLNPLLVGYSSGATLAYANLAQAPKDTFAGALTLGFCPTLNMRKPMCKGLGLNFNKRADGHGAELLPDKSLEDPWIALQGSLDQICDPLVTQKFVAAVPGAEVVMLDKVGHGYTVPARWVSQYKAAYLKLASSGELKQTPLPPAALGDLPVVEVAAQPGHGDTDLMAVILSGDGGWAGLDQEVAAAISAQGIPVVGVDSLRYYWTPRTPEGLAGDMDRLVRYYLAHWQKQRVMFIGYSQGADVLAFALNRLPPATHKTVALGVLMGLGEHASFEFHMSNWVSDTDDGPATLPEVNKVSGITMLCIYGEGEDDSVCPLLDANRVKVVKLKGGHHFDGDYQRLAQEILNAAKPAH